MQEPTKAREEAKYIDKTIIVPATAKVVPTQHIVYDCADGSVLYRKWSTTVGFLATSSTGYLTAAGGGITSGDESYYKDSNPDEPKDDGQHYCITKEHTTTPPKSSTD